MKEPAETPRVTLANVAELAGVSTATVSLILSGREGWLKQFHPDTIRRVQSSAKRLRYRTNLFASSLPTRASSFFALVTRDIGRQGYKTERWHLWSFEGDLLAGVMKEALGLGLYPILTTTDPQADQDALRPLETIIEGGVIGSIVRSPDGAFERYIRRQLRRGLRLVVLFPNQPSRWNSNIITNDDARIGELAARLLTDQGRRRLAVVYYENVRPRESHMARRRSFEAAAGAVDASVKIVRLPRDFDQITDRHFEQIGRLRIDGVFALDSVLSVTATKTLFRMGREPQNDIDIVGVNCSQWREFPLPPITCIDISWQDAGIEAIRALSRMVQEGTHTFDPIQIRPTIIPGETCRVSSDLLSGHGRASP